MNFLHRKAKVYHIGVHPSAQDVPFVESLRATGAEVVSIETYTHAEDMLTRSELQYVQVPFPVVS